jgi:Zn-dependent metalloprotease
MTSHQIERIRTAAVAIALVALVTPLVPASPRAEDPGVPAIRQFSEESPIPEVRDALARIQSNGRLRRVRVDKRTGRAAAVFGDLGRVGNASTSGTVEAVGDESGIEYLEANRELLGAADARSELALERRVDGHTGSHLFYQQRVGARPVFGARASVHVAHGGEVYGVTSSYVPGLDPALAAADPSVDESTARAVALEKLGVTPAQVRDAVPFTAELGVAPVDSGRLAWRLVVPVAEPFGQWEVFVDAGSGDVIGEPRSLLLKAGDAKVFAPNPIVTTGLTSLQDADNAESAVPSNAYTPVTLQGLDASGLVTGAYCTTDLTPNRVKAAGGGYTSVLRGANGFEEVEAYWAIDTAQRYIQSQLGIANAADYQIRVNVHATSADNSYYVSNGDGTGHLEFGDGGVNDAQDAEIVWHEYGHALLDNMAKIDFSGEAHAIHEGWGDYVAATMSTTVAGDPRFYSTIGEWDATSYSSDDPPYLRRVDGTKQYPSDLDGEEHDDGEIWSACLWGIHQALGRSVADPILFNANFLFAPDVDFTDAAAAIAESDIQLNHGANGATIVAVFAAHGITVTNVAPVISGVKIKTGKLTVDGSNFEINGAVIEVDENALSSLKYPKAHRRKGFSLRVTSTDARVASLQRGVAVQVTVLNRSSGVRSAPFSFTP